MNLQPVKIPRTCYVVVMGLLLTAFACTASADPPDRVARVSYLQGNVSFQPSGDDQWVQASLNRPLVAGDKLYTDRDSRTELEIGGATIRIDQGTTFDLLDLGDTTAQIELTAGVADLHVRHLGDGERYEVDTPTLAFIASQPGNYRIDIAPDGSSTMVTVFDGSGDVYGQNNASYSVRAGNSYRFHDQALTNYEVLALPPSDDFDRWCATREERYGHSVSRQYVSDGVIGSSDLDDNGTWSNAPDYGNVWYPTTVAAGWAPYRNGYWSWIDPWGWTWIDSAPWGFAPFHYGRWAYIGNRWGWCPGPRIGMAVYAPAMVAFVGGGGWGSGISVGVGGGPIGWFPLGPRDVYVPWYHASHRYFTNINVHNTRIINNTYITNVYNDYSRGQPITNARYTYRNNSAALTAVPRAAFVGARRVNDARVQVNAATFRDAHVVSRLAVAPVRASFVGADAARARAVPKPALLDRRVIARTAPPVRSVPIASRVQAIQRNGGQPLQRDQLTALAAQRPAAARPSAAARVQVVNHGGKPQPLPMSGARGPAAANRPATPGATTMPRNPPATMRPGSTRPVVESHPQPGGTNRNALPSSRFAPSSGGSRTVPENRVNAAENHAETRTPARGTVPNTTRQTSPRTERVESSTTGSRTMPSTHFAPQERTAPQRSTERSPPSRSTGTTEHVNPRATPRTEPRPVESDRQIRSAPSDRELPHNNAPPQHNKTPERIAPRSESLPAQQNRPPMRVVPHEMPQPQSRPESKVQQGQRRAPEKQDKDKDKDKDNHGHR